MPNDGMMHDVLFLSLPVILFYTGRRYWVFRDELQDGAGYE